VPQRASIPHYQYPLVNVSLLLNLYHQQSSMHFIIQAVRTHAQQCTLFDIVTRYIIRPSRGFPSVSLRRGIISTAILHRHLLIKVLFPLQPRSRTQARPGGSGCPSRVYTGCMPGTRARIQSAYSDVCISRGQIAQNRYSATSATCTPTTHISDGI